MTTAQLDLIQAGYKGM